MRAIAAPPPALHPSPSEPLALRRDFSRRTVALCLLGIAVVSSVLRIALASRMHAAIVFNDELGYQRLAQSIGLDGRLQLFGNGGLSYSPLYPAVLSPIYALGASAPLAYTLIKTVNAILLSLSVVPVYMTARFVLPRDLSVLAALLAALAPLMAYSSFTMSENLAYPLCLLAVWALLAAIVRPGPRADVVLLAAILVTSAARIQLVVLLPVALTAIVVVGVLDHEASETARRSLLRRVRAHALLFGVVAAGFVVAGVVVFAGGSVYGIAGRYSNVGPAGVPNLWKLTEQTLEHLAGIDLAVGVVPFVAALVVGSAFVRARAPRRQLPFAAVAASLTAWLVLETAWDAVKFDSPGGDAPRIHERFLIYVVPLFLVALIAAYQHSARGVSARRYLGAATGAALLPVLIPYHTVVNDTVVVDSFGLEPFARIRAGGFVPIPHVLLAAVCAAATFALLYVYVRTRLRSVVMLVLIAFIVPFWLETTRLESGGSFLRSILPQHTDWVDRAKPGGDVAVVTAAGSPVPALETAFANLSIARAYALCGQAFGPDFGELLLTVDQAGRLRDPSGGLIRASSVVVPTTLGVRGRVLARNPEGRQLLVAPTGGVLSVLPATRYTICQTRRFKTA